MPWGADRRSHEPARKGDLVVGLDEQMNVVGLHGKVNDSKPRSGGMPDRASNLLEHDLLPQAGQTRRRAKRDVDRMRLPVLGSRAMRRAPSARRTLSTGAASLAAECSKLESLLAPPSHVIEQ